jgi:hypothetical protein
MTLAKLSYFVWIPCHCLEHSLQTHINRSSQCFEEIFCLCLGKEPCRILIDLPWRWRQVVPPKFGIKTLSYIVLRSRSLPSTKACKPTSAHTFTNHTCFTHFVNVKWKPNLLHKCEVTKCSSSGEVLMWTELMWLTWTPQTCSDVIRSFLVNTVRKYMYKYFMRVETWC